MINLADAAGMRLTLMFTAQMAQYIAGDVNTLKRVGLWSRKGHEIAFHHHDVYHGNGWDGYTDIPKGEADALDAYRWIDGPRNRN